MELSKLRLNQSIKYKNLIYCKKKCSNANPKIRCRTVLFDTQNGVTFFKILIETQFFHCHEANKIVFKGLKDLWCCH